MYGFLNIERRMVRAKILAPSKEGKLSMTTLYKSDLSSISERELSQELNISLSKLRKDRERGKHYSYFREGRAIRYRIVDVLNELKAKTTKAAA